MFAMIDEKEVERLRELPKGEILAYLGLRVHMNTGSKKAWPGYAKIADRMGVARRCAIRAVKKLLQKGFLKLNRASKGGRGQTNYYRFPLVDNCQNGDTGDTVSRSKTVTKRTPKRCQNDPLNGDKTIPHRLEHTILTKEQTNKQEGSVWINRLQEKIGRQLNRQEREALLNLEAHPRWIDYATMAAGSYKGDIANPIGFVRTVLENQREGGRDITKSPFGDNASRLDERQQEETFLELKAKYGDRVGRFEGRIYLTDNGTGKAYWYDNGENLTQVELALIGAEKGNGKTLAAVS